MEEDKQQGVEKGKLALELLEKLAEFVGVGVDQLTREECVDAAARAWESGCVERAAVWQRVVPVSNNRRDREYIRSWVAHKHATCGDVSQVCELKISGHCGEASVRFAASWQSISTLFYGAPMGFPGCSMYTSLGPRCAQLPTFSISSDNFKEWITEDDRLERFPNSKDIERGGFGRVLMEQIVADVLRGLRAEPIEDEDGAPLLPLQPAFTVNVGCKIYIPHYGPSRCNADIISEMRTYFAARQKALEKRLAGAHAQQQAKRQKKD